MRAIEAVHPALVDAVLASSLFTDVEPALRTLVLPALRFSYVPAGAVLFQEGDPSDCLYVLACGRLEALAARPGGERLLGLIYPGDTVGEMGLIGRKPRSASVRASRNSVVARLEREAFESLVRGSPDAALGLLRQLATWLEKGQGKGPVPAPARVLAVVPASPHAPVAWVAEQLARELGRGGRVQRVDGRRAAETLDTAASPESRALWLHELEASGDVLLLEGEAAASPWTELCSRNADVVLVVAHADDAAAVRPPTSDAPAGRARRRELVLVHAATGPRRGVAALWRRGAGCEAHHNVRAGHAADVARVARLVTGRAVALALGGGGARGFAHLGVIQALDAAGIPLDLVCGTSMGAIVGASLAVTLDPRETARDLRHRFHELNPFDSFVPYFTPTSSRRFDATLQETFGAYDLEDTWLPFYCVSCTLESAQAVRHERGPLWRAVRASCALPGVFPAVEIDGELHVDGAFLDNVPSELAAERGRGRTVAVNVMPAYDPMLLENMATGPVQRLLVRRLLTAGGLGRGFLPNVLMRSFFLGPIRDALNSRESVDLYIEPDVSAFGFLDLSAFDKIVEVGRHAAERALADAAFESP